MNEPLAKSDDSPEQVYRDPFELVNAHLARFGREVQTQFDALDEDGYTDLGHGEVIVGINVLREPELLLLLVRMADCPADPARERTLYRTLLEQNFLATQDSAFAIDDAKNAIYLRAMRSLHGLEYDEFRELLESTVAVAEELLEQLAAELEG